VVNVPDEPARLKVSSQDGGAIISVDTISGEMSVEKQVSRIRPTKGSKLSGPLRGLAIDRLANPNTSPNPNPTPNPTPNPNPTPTPEPDSELEPDSEPEPEPEPEAGKAASTWPTGTRTPSGTTAKTTL
jgi:outer membrane biosynthesis protein TonB